MQESSKETVGNYLCIMLRISNLYLVMTIIQLTLASCILVSLYFSMMELVSLVQIWVFFFISLDLLIKYCSEGRDFMASKWNRIDLVILLVLGASITVEILFPRLLYHPNNIAEAVIMILRYAIQFYRVYTLIRSSQQLRQLQNQTRVIEFHSLEDYQTDLVNIVGKVDMDSKM